MRIIKSLIIVIAIALQSCGGGGDDAPAPPQLGNFSLSFPNNNEICTEGIEMGNNMIEIPFRWTASSNATSYSLEVTNTITGQKYEANSNTNSDEIILPKGTQFTWKVTASLNGNTKDSNGTWSFYSEGNTTSNHIPFPATITLEDNKDGTINILWQGSDLDNDIDYYEVYLLENQAGGDPQLIASIEGTSILNYQIKYDVEYSLQVITRDINGNSSTSNRTFMFRS